MSCHQAVQVGIQKVCIENDAIRFAMLFVSGVTLHKERDVRNKKKP